MAFCSNLEQNEFTCIILMVRLTGSLLVHVRFSKCVLYR